MSEKVPSVLLPAFMTTKTPWRHQIDALADIAEIGVVHMTRHDSIDGMAAAVLGAKLVVVENCGHFSAIGRPAEGTAARRAWLLSTTTKPWQLST